MMRVLVLFLCLVFVGEASAQRGKYRVRNNSPQVQVVQGQPQQITEQCSDALKEVNSSRIYG